jgi:quinol monooxygenase YgiN
MITIFGTLHLDPARREEAVREFQRLVDETRGEPGCTHYVVSADLVEPNTLYIFEEWADIHAIETHQGSEHFTSHQTRAAGHILAAEINRYADGLVERRTIGTPPTG